MWTRACLTRTTKVGCLFVRVRTFAQQGECIHVLKGLALPRASHSDEIALAGAFHACGSASPFCGCCCHSSQQQVLSPSENVHALEGLACRKRVAPASSPAAPASRERRMLLSQTVKAEHKSDAMSYSGLVSASGLDLSPLPSN